MMMKRYCVGIALYLFATFYSGAQDINSSLGRTGEASAIDTIPEIIFDESSLDNVIDLNKQFEKQNKTYSIPKHSSSSNLLRFVKKDELNISDEALYWARLVRDASNAFHNYMTFRDTIIINDLFLTPLFRGNILPADLTFYNKDIVKHKSPYDFMYKPDTTLFADYFRKKAINDSTLQRIEINHLDYFRYSERDLPGETVVTEYIRKPIQKEMPILVKSDVSFDDVDAPQKFIPDRQYWMSSFESALQFSQNYVSKNWHKGGSSNLNIYSKNYLRYDYKKDKVQITNEAEITANIYNAPNDTLRDYKIGNDIFKFHNNIGYKAFSKWYYTLDTEFITQLFTNHEENTHKVYSAFLSPFMFNAGLGMKYDLEKKFTKRHKNLKLSVNLAPLAYTFKYSTKKGPDMDLGRHGFDKKDNPEEGENAYKNVQHIFGPSVRVEMLMNFNRNISWQSRLYFKTNLDENLIEFENTLTLAISRFFSTRIYFYPRYDDKKTGNEDRSNFQLNELLSFGFNYKW
ncbi:MULTISPECIES: DUF3078 domain-containing protein [unclassified Parabacteroides]|uniref:DUF3078 domain-containing protein n=1 Tax=unclassified Parabacteroides TaxID=2649774 RepID=UPI0024750322|nr:MULTISPECIES: DUF3078 domain-containing protein [unclassified Parabacteroides]MDH6304563.1 hypothetical protein [Parabacteroides sp. PH5-39]MDH6323214.1 hypothetical protein [Parabacteroides sp. PH5-8]MDH6384064.1 hypothetical protein [Parabacteroides sp. PH5-17]MDH6393182.1 hypothetical protein [Parabacteroides sp. PFB2-22]